MNDIKRLKDQQRDKHPGFDAYLNCMTRALFSGLASFCLTFSGSYFTQKVVRTKIYYPIQYSVLVSALAAIGVSYMTTTTRTKACQAAWMAAEDKHSVLKEDIY
ncbi:transmembrane protein 141 [Bactrocera neohumeralis]|uniref:transmembrane protein 141 n=1 Tax=Bactrocera tryoni TaxID=59916 RepID=UPI001A95C74F|nr:transmembrane protein 141 [Bactrocera tryoni]XP_039961188.1 transmembrane protein 141 [Bactrocera tryoni]XP_039961196.1 transmembrane protein 141 [Bactrocera tryoni]XP_039961203.1 transmembrane protein 141 [Bactrocera tryoni]XP_050317024.1 transmembrane protein 141 [Bactrocera neohumeralis]XP_050317025.1 transmembrane protein 141 [Bactrocera neohumeralis]XP_050317027.1 transmembrane protein 141 [Bactrocera neohumeralis]